LRIAVIGAGAAGLSAAYDFVNDGHSVVVYEAEPFVGGQASTIEVGGGRLERAYHHLFTSDTAILDLMAEVGLADRMEWLPSKVGLFAQGRIYDFTTPFDLLRFPLVSIWDRLKLGLVSMRLQRRKDWRSLEPFTADAWIREHVGARAHKVLWGPLLRAKFGARHEQVGMPWFWSKMQTRFASRSIFGREVLGYPVNSFQEIFDVLRERVEDGGGRVMIETRVERILMEDGSAAGVAGRGPDGTAFQERFDAVLATVPSYAFMEMAPFPPAYREKLEGIHYLSAVILILETTRQLTHVYWMNIADAEIPFLGVIEHTNLIPRDRYDGNRVLYLTNYVDPEDAVCAMSADDLLDLYMPHLEKFNPAFDRSWVKRVHRVNLAAAQPIVGTHYSERIPAHRTPFERLYLANTTQVYPEDRGTNYSVRIGRDVARAMMDDLA